MVCACLAASLGAGCAQDGKNGVASVDLYDRKVDCGELLCSDPARPEAVASPDDPGRGGIAFLSRAASQFGGSGLYLYLELQRPGGVVGVLELDLPAAAGGAAPHAVYQELRGGVKLFSSGLRAGRVELPSSESCPCQDLRLELVFTDLGPDGIAGTDDDRTRRLSRGVVAASESFCLGPQLLSIASPDTLEVGRTCHAPFAPAPSGGGGTSSGGGYVGGGYHESVEVGCSGEPAYEQEDTGCDGSGGSDYDYDGSSGCDGDGLSDSSSGCDGGDFGDSASGCDGGGSSASCAGDAFAAVRPGPRRSPARARLLGALLPFALFAAFTVYLRRRSRRGPRR